MKIRTLALGTMSALLCGTLAATPAEAAPSRDYKVGYANGQDDGQNWARAECRSPYHHPGRRGHHHRAHPRFRPGHDPLEYRKGYRAGFNTGFDLGILKYCPNDFRPPPPGFPWGPGHGPEMPPPWAP